MTRTVAFDLRCARVPEHRRLADADAWSRRMLSALSEGACPLCVERLEVESRWARCACCGSRWLLHQDEAQRHWIYRELGSSDRMAWLVD